MKGFAALLLGACLLPCIALFQEVFSAEPQDAQEDLVQDGAPVTYRDYREYLRNPGGVTDSNVERHVAVLEIFVGKLTDRIETLEKEIRESHPNKTTSRTNRFGATIPKDGWAAYNKIARDNRKGDLTEAEYQYLLDNMPTGDGLRNFTTREWEAIEPQARESYQSKPAENDQSACGRFGGRLRRLLSVPFRLLHLHGCSSGTC